MRNALYRILSTVMIVTSFMIVSGSIASVVNVPSVHADTVSDIRSGVTGVGGTGAKNQGQRIGQIVRIVVNILLFLIGAFAVIMIVIAGFRLVAANGDSNTVSSAKNTILYAVIGLIVAFLAYALVNFIVGQL